jgi:hypothetical protein
MNSIKKSRFSIECTCSAFPHPFPELVTEAFWWFIREENLESVEVANRHIVFNLHTYKSIKCHGQIREYGVGNSGTDYVIDLDYEQNLRDFIATVMHELLHLRQYETGVWSGDGEKECELQQYELADKFWRQGFKI